MIVVEIMGHRSGWLALGAGLAGGADVILIPEIPYSEEKVADAIQRRVASGSNFSIVAVAEGARNALETAAAREAEARRKSASTTQEEASAMAAQAADQAQSGNTFRLAGTLERLTGLESRVTILGYVQRGGAPSPADRVLATRLGTVAADLVSQGVSGVMVASRGEGTEPVPLDQVAGKRHLVPTDHPWVQAARSVGTSFGD